MRRLCTILLALLALAAGTAVAAEPVAKLECREILNLDWPRTLVTYQLVREDFKPTDAQRKSMPYPSSPAYVSFKGKTTGADLHLFEAAGKEVPSQLWQVTKDAEGNILAARLSFFAELKAKGSYAYELRTGPLGPTSREYLLRLASAKPIHDAPDQYLTLDNGKVALSLPKEGQVKFDQPLPFGHDIKEIQASYGHLDAYRPEATKGIAPGPIQRIKLIDGNWAGGSFFYANNPAAAPKVTGYVCKVLETGPLFTTASVRYSFSNGGWYELTARLQADDPAIYIDEQFDLGEPSDGGPWDYYQMVVSLGNGWRPDTTYYFGPAIKQQDADFNAKLKAASQPVHQDCSSRKLAFDKPSTKLFDIAVRYPWNPNAYFFALAKGESLTAENLSAGKAPFLAVVPMHTGNWRGTSDVRDGEVFTHEGGDVSVWWRMRASYHPRSMLHTGEYDPDQPLTLCRRQWALIAGAMQPYEKLHRFRSYDGFITLDDYKDWQLDWPADPKITYPRLLLTKADVERLKPSLDSQPGAATLKTYLYFNDTDERRKALIDQTRVDSTDCSPYGLARYIIREGDPPNMPWATHYRLSQMSGWTSNMDELLSSDKLPAEERTQLRRQLAAVCYLLSEPDVNPRGALTHLGNPNMPINRFCALPWSAALIPDHPMANTWLDTSAKYIRYKLAMNTAPNGTWSELMTYFDASAPHIMQTASVLAGTGRLDETTARAAVYPAQFTMNLLTPKDPRFACREVVGWGHEGVDNPIQYLVAANAIRRFDPKLAADFMWAWDQAGRPMNAHHDAGFSPRAQFNADLLGALKSDYVPSQLADKWLPGFGVNMRNHAGDANEIFFSFRQGYCVSHCDPNQGDFVLFAKGEPLVSLMLGAYPLNQHPAFQQLSQTLGWHGRVRFGKAGNDGGWPGGGAYGGVPAFAFGDSASYLRAIGDYGPQRWTRQAMFMKARTAAGPDYLVFRDSFAALEGKQLEPTFWTIRNPGPKDSVKLGENSLTYTAPKGATLDVRILQPEKLAAESHQASRDEQLYFSNARNWLKAGSPVVKKEHDDLVTITDTLTVTTFGPVPAGKDIVALLYPRDKDEAAPKVETPAAGVMKVTTAKSTDYVFLGPSVVSFKEGDVSFEGQAGVVRVSPDEVHLIVSEGPATVTYKGITLRSPVPAAKVIPIAQLGKPQTIEVPQLAPTLAEMELPEGCRIEGHATCQLTVEKDRLTGKSDGLGGFLYAPMPAGLKVLPMLVIDGQNFAPGTSGNTLIIPLLPGKHDFEVRALDQPPVFRNWQAW